MASSQTTSAITIPSPRYWVPERGSAYALNKVGLEVAPSASALGLVADQLEVAAVLQQPFDTGELLSAIETALAKH